MKPLQTLWDSLTFIHSVKRYDHVRMRKPGQLRQLQLSLFRRMLRHAHRHSPFWRRRLAGLNLHRALPCDIAPLTKPEMMANFDDFATDRRITKEALAAFTAEPTNFGKFFLDEYSVCHTSGSQGQPAFVVQNRQAFLHLFAMQIARGHSLPKTAKELGTRLVSKKNWVIFMLKPGFFPSAAAFGYMPAAVKRFARIHVLRLSDPWEENLAKLNAIQPNFITAYTHVHQNLARAQQEGQLRLKPKQDGGQLELLISMSEPLYPETRAQIQEAMGVHVSNHYAMAECMALTLGCPVSEGAHLNQDLALLEVVDRNYEPVADGQPGERVLITNLYNGVQPIIRYEIDDVVTVSKTPCPCGNNMPLIQSIAGRSNDRLWVDVGGQEREVPRFVFQAAFLPFYDLAEFQVVQTTRTRFKVYVQAVKGKSLDPQRIREAVRQKQREERMADWFDLDVEVTAEIKPDPRSGKKRRYVNLTRPQNLSAPPQPPGKAAYAAA